MASPSAPDPDARPVGDPAEPVPEVEADPGTAAVDGDPDAGAGEAEQPPAVDPEVLRRRREALRHVRKFGDPVLRTRAIEIDRFDETLREQVEWMGVLMEEAMGVGLAATQIGVLHRLLVYRVQHESRVIALVNPEIEWTGDEQETMEEGCLSLPGVLVDVERPVRLRVRAQDEFGAPLMVEASGLEARVIAHEVDHLDGVLILDRTSREQRREAMRAMREAAAAAAAGSGGNGS
ncbi:MAG: peptide deformylase [Solirubrobacteraceae bacterium]